MRRTSVEVYRRIRREGLLSGARLAVYGALFEAGPMTGSELNAHLRSKSAHKRLSELLEQGAVAEAGLKVCSRTGERVVAWDVTDAEPRGLDRPKGIPRPSPTDVRIALQAMRERHEQAPFGPETVRVMRWLKERFREERAKPTAAAENPASATNRTLPMSPPVRGDELH